MKKGEAEKVWRYFASDWASKNQYVPALGNLPSYSDIRMAVREQCPDAFNFRSTMGVHETTEFWIDNEL